MLIETIDIGKVYPPQGTWRPFGRGKAPPALQGIGLKLRSGSVTGLAGPNGAGKSTLLRILAGRLIPDRGRILMNGRETDDAGLRNAAALVETGTRGFYPRLNALENLYFFGALRGLSHAEVRKRAEPLRNLLAVRDKDLEIRFDGLSEGAAQKISLLRALIARPSLLLLDEPARNLDLRSAEAFAALVRAITSEGRTAVLYASHNPGELAGTCTCFLALKEGRQTTAAPGTGNRGMESDIARACLGEG